MKVMIGRYVPGNSLIHRLDPRTKLATVFFFVMVVFMANNEISYGVLLLFAGAVIGASKVPVGLIVSGLRPVAILVVFTFLLHTFMTQGGEVLFSYRFIEIHEAGLRQGVFISLRFLLLVTMASMLTFTTTPIEITDGLESLMKPLNKIKVPVHEIALLISISLRFIPTLSQETDKIMRAQSARGVDFSTGPMRERIGALVSLLVPLFVGAFKRAEELAVAMEARGYKGGDGRSKYRELKWHVRDGAAVLAFLSLVVILHFVRN